MSDQSTQAIARARRGLTAFVATVAMLCGGDHMRAATPADFTDALVATVGYPTALAFTPDGRLLITTQLGALRVFQGGALVSTPALSLGSRVCTNSERGLLGIAVDPGFASNGFIYLYYTSNTNGCVNRVSRFMLPVGNVIDLSTEVVLIDNIYAPYGNHNAGDLRVGKDGYLYISVGNGAFSPEPARDLSKLNGKILRLTLSGGIPAGNPYQGPGTARCASAGGTTSGIKCQEIFASGLRNPFRMAFDPNAVDTRFFINDVGQNTWEEIDLATVGADYGWPDREGHCANGSTSNCGTSAGLTNPIYDYGRGSGCGAITGGAFVPNGVWPATYDGAYLFSDYVCGTIFTLPSGPPYSGGTFATNLGGSSAVAMTFGPHLATQALYYTTYAGGGQVRRIAYTGTVNRSPVAVATATPASGLTPLHVTFDGSGSSDPDNNPLTYDWSFGDGTPNASTAITSHDYGSPAVYTATLTVRDNLGATGTATVTIDAGNTAPVPTIVTPSVSTHFRVGQSMTLQGQATDLQNGTLADSRLTWTVVRHHDTHTHPYFPPTAGNNLVFTMPAPEDFLAAGNSYLEIQLTATDLGGLSTTIGQDLRPNTVNVTFNTEPAGLHVDVNGTSLTSQTVVSWEGYVMNASAPAQMDSNGQWWTFASWSDGGSSSHAITTPASAAAYTATFTPASGPPVPTAVFAGTDTTTQGTWSGVYGRDGYATVNDATSYPTYAQVTLSGPSAWTWQASTTDVRALQRASGVGRMAATWFNGNTFTIDVNLPLGTPRQVAIYMVDWDSTTRGQRLDVLDAGTGAVLDTRTLTGFNGGKYLVWTVNGHVSFRVTRTAGANAVVSGFFFDTPGPADVPPTVALTVPSVPSSFAAPATVDLGATAGDSDGSVSRVDFFAGQTLVATAAAAPYQATWNTTTGGVYSVTARAVDNMGATTTSTPVTVTITASTPPGPTAVFVGTDTTTQGNWTGVYGHDGYATVNDATSYPAFAQVTLGGTSAWTWQASTTDVRALQRASGVGRIAATWFNTTFTFGLNLVDGAAHRVALYMVDWDSTSRGQRIDILNASTGTVLDTRTLSGFNGGRYLVWTVSGNVTIRVTRTAGANAVVSGLYFD